MDIKLRIILEALVTSMFFGMWQNSVYAGGFMFFGLITLAMINLPD